MSEYKNAVCAVCGAGYRVCAACRNRKTIKSWRTITDSAECYKIYMILHDYTAGFITRESARRMLVHVLEPESQGQGVRPNHDLLVTCQHCRSSTGQENKRSNSQAQGSS